MDNTYFDYSFFLIGKFIIFVGLLRLIQSNVLPVLLRLEHSFAKVASVLARLYPFPAR